NNLLLRKLTMQLQVLESSLKDLLPHDLMEHSIRVKDFCVKLANHYNADPDKFAIAGLLHDCGRVFNSGELISKAEDLDIPITEVILSSPSDILHGFVGSYYAREKFNVNDHEILSAINCHTFGANEMSLLCKALFIAEKVNPRENSYPLLVSEISEVAFKDIDQAVVMAFDMQIKYLLDNKKLVYSQVVNSRNKILQSLKQ